jgi:putative hemolysin
LEDDPEQIYLFLQTILLAETAVVWLAGILVFILLIGLLFLSGCVSASENAFFSLTPQDLSDLEEDEAPSAQTALQLITRPNRQEASQNLLGTILVLNNFVNIAIIILSTYAMGEVWKLLQTQVEPWLSFLIEVVLITFILVLFGEIIPKIFATQNNIRLVKFTSRFLQIFGKILFPIVWLLTRSTQMIQSRLSQKVAPVSIEELNQAIDLASEDEHIEEKSILKGIINFGNINVKQIMCPRLDVKAVSQATPQSELIQQVHDWGFSRVPVFEESFDKVVGVLYLKDLIMSEILEDAKPWTSLVREPFFVPANKKIDDLLREFQDRRTHMAIVVDEYGGSLGIVTMEDILEEIFGDIKDEFDEDDLIYSKLDDQTYIFEAKILLTDITKILEIRQDRFEEVKGESDTLGGLLMEIHEKIPSTGEEIVFENFRFLVEAADKRKIKRVKVTILHEDELEAEQDEEEE